MFSEFQGIYITFIENSPVQILRLWCTKKETLIYKWIDLNIYVNSSYIPNHCISSIIKWLNLDRKKTLKNYVTLKF